MRKLFLWNYIGNTSESSQPTTTLSKALSQLPAMGWLRIPTGCSGVIGLPPGLQRARSKMAALCLLFLFLAGDSKILTFSSVQFFTLIFEFSSWETVYFINFRLF